MKESNVNLNINNELWDTAKVRAAELRVQLKEFVTRALNDALDDPSFSVASVTSGPYRPKNVVLSEELWKRVGIKAAEIGQETSRSVSRRAVFETALARALQSSDHQHMVPRELREFCADQNIDCVKLLRLLAVELRTDINLQEWLKGKGEEVMN